MKKLLLLFIIFTCQSAFAADDGDFWLQREIETYDGNSQYAERKSKVYGKSARMFREEVPISDSTKTQVRDLIKRSIAVDTPTASKVGAPMLKRIQSLAKGNAASLASTAAVTGLLAAIGWVMEDGTYVKYKQPEPSPSCGLNGEDCTELLNIWYISSHTQFGTFSSALDAATYYFHNYTSPKPQEVENPQCTLNANGTATCTARIKNGYGYWVGTQSITVSQKTNTKYIGPKPPEKVTLTAPTLGAVMLGAGYSDPAGDSSAEEIINTGDYTGVKEIYEHDPTGIGNEVAEDMDRKLRNAPDTGGTPSYVGDPSYDSADLPADSDAADRSWTEDGGEATGGTEQEVDSEGNPTGNTSISLKFPLFCTWASEMCQWYDNWKKSDQIYKDHMTKTEEHQKDEKSFWDWFQKDDLPNNEQDSEVEDENQLPELSTDTFNFGGMCPSDINLPIPDPFGHTNNLTLSFQTFCLWLTKLNPWIDVLGWIIAITILTGQRSANNEQ